MIFSPRNNFCRCNFKHWRDFIVQKKKKKVADFIRSRSLVKMGPGIVNQSRAEVEAGNL